MKKKLFAFSRGKYIAPQPMDFGAFAAKISIAMRSEKTLSLGESSMSIRVRHRMLLIGYTVDFEVRSRKISWQVGYENIVSAITVAAFAGLLVFKGRLDTYVFWAAVLSGAIFWLNNVLTHGRIKAAVQQSAPVSDPAKRPGVADGLRRCSITQQARCSACGCVLTGFGPLCPGCGITLGRGTESASRLCGWRFKYFFREK